ncbi:hypothetical protein [Paenibacillus thalictri]|uniref:DUF4352 domain-containing protein n=1 Tax=Paenibacillus thalictri TaxID=2527873 RepID=A0A4Q9DYQ2_9BACL|nr:hypothetical protein [Paenibacillus thalictri]TBL81240.1 hypothetical protein EYB31_03895 [Paenibacillus thalictri]
MNKKLKKTIVSIALTASLMNVCSYAAWADEPVPAKIVKSAASAQYYNLTDKLDVQITSMLNERADSGTRIGVTIKMRNNGTSVTRVPDYELRVTTSDNVTYTLQPSAANVKSVQPKTEAQLSYLAVIDRTDDVQLNDVSWIDVDYYVYPKKETLIVSAPVATSPWKGSDSVISDENALLKWSDTFTLPYSDSKIEYTPTGIHKELTDKGTVYVVQLIAVNPSDKRETVPSFTLDGKSKTKNFAGKRVEQDAIVIESKEQKYIHFAIPTDQDTLLTSLNVLTSETFASASATGASSAVQYQVGRYNIALENALKNGALPYTLGQAMAFDSRSDLIHPDLQVSLVEFTMDKNDEEGSQKVTGKFLLKNKSDRPMTVPNFDVSLLSTDGYEYSGARQKTVAASILPNSGVIVNFGFTLPSTESGQNLTVKVQDAVTAAPYKTTIAAYSAPLQAPPKGDKFSMYPFDITVENWDISYLFSNLMFSYKGKFILDIKRQNETQVDNNYSKLQFELYDGIGRLVGTSTKAMIGQGRLVSGENNITFDGSSEQFESPLRLKVFEIFPTANGDAKRLLAEFEK